MRKSFCLNSIASSKQINGSPLNTSPSKNLYSFSKQDRFKQQMSACDRIYELPSLRPSKYGVGIGRGNKSDFTRDKTVSPPASRYTRMSFFEENKKRNKGCSIALGRDKLAHQGYLDLSNIKVPGPGSYNGDRLSKGSLYSMRPRTKVLDKRMTLEPQNSNPGPGTYEDPEALSPKGKYSSSKHHGVGSLLISSKSQKRFAEFKNQVPGPGNYNTPAALTGNSKYINSKHIGTGLRAFTLSKRISKFDEISENHRSIPGPGSYRQPSDFGQYDGNVYNTISASRIPV